MNDHRWREPIGSRFADHYVTCIASTPLATEIGDAPVNTIDYKESIEQIEAFLGQRVARKSRPICKEHRLISGRELRSALDNGDAGMLERLIAIDDQIPLQYFTWGLGCAIGPCQPIGYLAQARFNGFVKHDRSDVLARLLLRAGAPVDGAPGNAESPLITAASYREAKVAQALIEAGANLEATGYAVEGGTALAHAIEFGAPEIVDMLINAGAQIRSVADAAGSGELGCMLETVESEDERAQAFRAATLCERLPVMDQLLETGLDINRLIKGGTVLHWAGWEAKATAARHLVRRGADFGIRDPEHQLTPLGWAKHRSAQCPHAHPGGHEDVIQFLEALT